MVRFSGRLVVLVAIALIVSSVQCAAACTPVSCVDPQPPCHHHKQAPANQKPASCAHELVPATIVQSFHADVLFSSEVVDARFISGVLVSLEMPAIRDVSPPGPDSSPPSVLRI
jgi:hypothetical protein